MNRIGKRLGSLIIAIAWVSGDLAAQTLRLPVEQPTHQLKIGQSIYLAEDDGQPRKARIVEITGGTLVVAVRDRAGAFATTGEIERRIAAERVTAVQRGDSVRNGALTGFLIGAGFALNRLGECEINCYGAFVPVLGGIGAAIGTLADA